MLLACMLPLLCAGRSYGVHGHGHDGGAAPPPPTCAMGLNSRDFGAVGDGAHDDTAALQAAVDEAQRTGRRLLVPAGDYAMNGTLHVRCYSSSLDPKYPIAHPAIHPLRMTGEGTGQTRFIGVGPVQNGDDGSAVLRMDSGQPTDGVNFTQRHYQHSNYHHLSHFTVVSQPEPGSPGFSKVNGKRDYGILAPAITRTTFEHIEVVRGRKAGIWASGWFIRIDSSAFLGNGVGIYLANEVNGIVISRCTIEDNFEPGVGIVVVQGENVAIENCGIEGNAGPAILASSITGAPIILCV